MGAEWCQHDPRFSVETASGRKFKFCVLLAALGKDNLQALKDADIDMRPQDNGQNLLVRLSIFVKGDFPLKITVSSKPNGGGDIYFENQEARAGRRQTIEFVVPQ